MFQLYKVRDFGAYFKDTFGFLRQHGKHFFKNYLIVNGIFILILTVMSYIFYDFYQDFIIGGNLNNNTALTNYLNENFSTTIVYVLIYILLAIVVGILNYVYVPIYFKLYEKFRGEYFEAKQIFDELLANIGKIFSYILVSILIAIPILIIVAIVGIILAITIIGIPFLLFLVALLSFFYHSALMEYIKSDKKGVFECFRYSLQLCFQKFFPTIGAIGVFMLLASIFQSIFSIIQFVVMLIMNVTSLENPGAMNDLEKWSTAFMIIFTLQIITYFINILVSAVLQINQAIVYYGLKEEKENINTQNTIEEIGTDLR